MREALLFIDVTEKNDRDIFSPSNYKDLQLNYSFAPSNSGNKLWLDAIEQYICQNDVKYSYYSGNMSAGEINERFEYVLYPVANLINADDQEKMDRLAELFKKISIPIFIVGLGAQAKNENEKKYLINRHGKTISRFIDSVLSTGGQIGVRGYFTKDVLHKLGFEEPKVIGCPSMFVNGPDYVLKPKKQNDDRIIPIVNGNTYFLDSDFARRIFNTCEDAIYVDQETFRELLFVSDGRCDSFFELFKLIQKYSYEGIRLFSQNRIKLFFDIPIWKEFLINSPYNFCLGSRIHGNIISVLCGIPSAVIYRDLRVKELAEYIGIPSFDFKQIRDKSIEQVYDLVDYGGFNKNYNSKYYIFKDFFESNGIANSIGDNSIYKKRISNISFDYPPDTNVDVESISSLISSNKLTGNLAKNVGTLVFNLKHFYM